MLRAAPLKFLYQGDLTILSMLFCVFVFLCFCVFVFSSSSDLPRYYYAFLATPRNSSRPY